MIGRIRAILADLGLDPQAEAMSMAALKVLMPLPELSFNSIDWMQVERMREWADAKQAWLDAQPFDRSVRRAYQGWIDHVRSYRVREARREIRKRVLELQMQQRPEFRR